MKKHANPFIFAADFETVVYENQKDTAVWAAAMVELYKKDVSVWHSIDEFVRYVFKIATKRDCQIYFHNLSFDGSFLIHHFLTKIGMHQAVEVISQDTFRVRFLKEKDMKNDTFKYLISNMGQWYQITVKVNNHFVTFYDSAKLLPFSLEEIGKSFDTQHKKLTMEYEGHRYPGCPITDEEMDYICNDVLVLKEALEFMFSAGHKKMTIGSCCLDEYYHLNLNLKQEDKDQYLKKAADFQQKNGIPLQWDLIVEKEDVQINFPNLALKKFKKEEESIYGSKDVDEYVRKAYRGAFVYTNPHFKNRVYHGVGLTVDVNSLYPSVMHSSSGNVFPIGNPTFFRERIPDIAKQKDKVYFVRFKCKFDLKPGYLPFVQIKNNFLYPQNENLTTSNIRGLDGKYYEYFRLGDQVWDSSVTMTMTGREFDLFQKHYVVKDLTILDGCWFYGAIGLFDAYIDKWAKVKMNSKGAMRQLAKLFLNNLYGKFGMSRNSSFKFCEVQDGVLKFRSIPEEDPDRCKYIPIGACVTSYAKCLTIEAAQANYYEGEDRGFIYADTDSLHCALRPEELKNVPIHENKFNHWKCETLWDAGMFVRSKTYIEHVTHENFKKVDPYYNVTCAGMPKRCKQSLIHSLNHTVPDQKTWFKLKKEEQDFILHRRSLADFTYGLKVPGKLVGTQIKGGKILGFTEFEMRD